MEYQLPGVNQVAVNTEIGMTFAAALRAMLRQAPNIIMVGEIRDVEDRLDRNQCVVDGALGVFDPAHQ